MKLFKRNLRITIYPDLRPLFNQREEVLKRELTEKEKEEISYLYPPVVINRLPDEYTTECSIIVSSTKVYELVLDVVNLSAFTRLHILNSAYNRITVEAGYLGKDWKFGDIIEDHNMHILFKGSLLWMGTSVKARKNITTRFVAIAGSTESLKAYSGLMRVDYEAGYNLWQLVREVSLNSNNPDIRLNLSEEDMNKLIEIPTGAITATELGQVLKNFSVEVVYDWTGTSTYSVDDYIKLNSKDNIGEIYPINEDTGLIDMPSLNGEREIKFKMILDPRMRVLDYVRLNNYDIQLPELDNASKESLSKANSGYYLDIDGIYRILRITYSLHTRGTPFTMDVEAVARDIYGKTKGSTG